MYVIFDLNGEKGFSKYFMVIYLVLKMKFLPQIDVLSRFKKNVELFVNKEYVSFEAYDNFLSLFLQISPFCL